MKPSGERRGCTVSWTGFAVGFLAVWPALLAGVWLQSWIPLASRSPEATLVYAALPEELIKFVAAVIINLVLGTPAALVGLGFGISETVFQLSHSPWPIRLLTSVPLHAGLTALATLLSSRSPGFHTAHSDQPPHTRHTMREHLDDHRGPARTKRTRIAARIIGTIALLALAILLHWVYNLAVRQETILHWLIAWIPLLLYALLRTHMHRTATPD